MPYCMGRLVSVRNVAYIIVSLFSLCNLEVYPTYYKVSGLQRSKTTHCIQYRIRSVPLDLHSLPISGYVAYSHVRYKLLFNYEEKHTSNMSKDVNQCPMARLVHTNTLSLQEFRLDRMPRYLALSHVWSEGLFPPTMVHNMTESRGLQMIQAAIHQKFRVIEHFWVDTWCIDQNDEDDKYRQIPQMGTIYRQAEAVLVTVNQELSVRQDEVDDILQHLQEAIDLVNGSDVWSIERIKYLASEEVVSYAIKAFKIIQKLGASPWCTRIWCVQEYVLAKAVIWIGQDHQPIHVENSALRALTELPTMSAIQEYRDNDEFNRILNLFATLSTFKKLGFDATRIMEAPLGRAATLEEDEIYALMEASGVTIAAAKSCSKESLWKIWWETAIREGNLRWALLINRGSWPDLIRSEEWNCVTTPCQSRCYASLRSHLNYVKPLGPVGFSDGTVKASGYWAGNCSDITLLGHYDSVFLPYLNWKSALSTITLFGKGDYDLTRRVIASFSYNLFHHDDIETLARLLCQQYPACRRWYDGEPSDCKLHWDNGEEGDLVYSYSREWANFFLSSIGCELYLCSIENDDKKTDIIIEVGQPIPSGNLIALDVNAIPGDQRANPDSLPRVLLIVRVPDEEPSEGSETSPAAHRQNSTLHKVGITLPIGYEPTLEKAEELNRHFTRGGALETYSIGGRSCTFCETERVRARELLDSEIPPGKDLLDLYEEKYGSGQIRRIR